MLRLEIANQTPRAAPSVDERSKTTTMTLAEPERGHGEGGCDESV